MKTHPNIPDPDGFYEAWLDAHGGLSDAESAELDSRLVMLLANQVGDQHVLLACIRAALEARRTPAPSTSASSESQVPSSR